MKKFIYCTVLGLIAFSAASTASATTVINFDDLTGPVQLSTQYAPQGVIFDQIEAAQNFAFNIIPPSAPNYASPFWSSTNPGTIEFVDPSNSNNFAFTDSVTITMIGLTASDTHPGSFSGATIDALDLSGNIIAGQTQIVAGTNVTTNNVDLTFTGQVHALRFTFTDGTQGALPFDDLTFGDLTSVPEPSTMAFVFASFAGFAALRARRKLN